MLLQAPAVSTSLSRGVNAPAELFPQTKHNPHVQLTVTVFWDIHTHSHLLCRLDQFFHTVPCASRVQPSQHYPPSQGPTQLLPPPPPATQTPPTSSYSIKNHLLCRLDQILHTVPRPSRLQPPEHHPPSKRPAQLTACGSRLFDKQFTGAATEQHSQSVTRC